MTFTIIDILAMWTPGPLELVVIGIISLLIFGKKLPEVARNLGKSLTEFKKGVSETKSTKDDSIKDPKKTNELNNSDKNGLSA